MAVGAEVTAEAFSTVSADRNHRNNIIRLIFGDDEKINELVH